MTKFPHLFSPLTIKSQTVKNRIVMAPVLTGLEGNEKKEEELVSFYRERAENDVGMFILANEIVDFTGKSEINTPMSLFRDIAKSYWLTSTIHSFGAKALLQLMHHGAGASHGFGVSASSFFNEQTQYTSRGLPSFMVERMLDKYAQKAKEAVERGGFDGVEIYGGQMSLPNTFNCPALNRRKDRWGGKNRFEFSRQLVQRVRRETGPDTLIAYRLSLMDLVPDGNRWDSLITFADQLIKEGVDLFSFDIGLSHNNIPVDSDITPAGVWDRFIGMFAEQVSVPIVFGFKHEDPDYLEELIKDYPTALIEIQKPLIADEQWAGKIKNNNQQGIRLCASSKDGSLINGTHEQPRLHCVGNPYLLEPKPVIEDSRRKILIVGAGPAGLGAAEEAARHGAQVVLVDEQPQLGGLFRLSGALPGHDSVERILKQREALLEALGVEIILNTKVDSRWIEENYPDHFVVLATGTTPHIPDIPGIDSPNVLTYEDLLGGKSPVGHRVAIIGSSSIGLDVARYLFPQKTPNLDDWLRAWGIGDPRQHQGGRLAVIPYLEAPKRTTYLVCLKRLGLLEFDLTMQNRLHELQWLRMNGVQTFSEADVTLIDNFSIRIRSESEADYESVLRIDHVVIADELEPRDELTTPFAARDRQFVLAGSVRDVNGLYGAGVCSDDGRAVVRQLLKKQIATSL